ncbi:MAG: tetratricopeptide repeat protein [Acidobacteriota bacterium]
MIFAQCHDPLQQPASSEIQKSATRFSPRLAIAISVLLLVTVGFLAPASADSKKAKKATQKAVKLIKDGKPEDALKQLDKAIEEDAEYWEAYYQRGRALGLLNRMEEARDSLLRAAELNPGHPHTHYLAWLAAFNAGDYETAWQQAILAHQAGTDMSDKFRQMAQRSAPPDDLEAQLEAPRIYVAAITSDEVRVQAELPYNTNPNSASAGQNPAIGGSGELSGRPDSIRGADRVRESGAEIARVQRLFREALQRSTSFGVVLKPEQADYVIAISIDKLSQRKDRNTGGSSPRVVGSGAREGVPRSMEAHLKLFERNNKEPIYFRKLSFKDIYAQTNVYGELERYINDMEKWYRER